MVLNLSLDNPSLASLLGELRGQCGDIEFGYRMQAMLAHVLIRLGVTILEMNAQGHPDIRAQLKDGELLVQVKTVLHRSHLSMFDLRPEDLIGISAAGRREGLLAVLDCAEPAQWVVITADRASLLVGQSVHVATLQAISHRELSSDYTAEFADIVRAQRERLRNLTYNVLRSRALSGAGI
jgi:hypothetical protein